jgi:hypothetical protein
VFLDQPFGQFLPEVHRPALPLSERDQAFLLIVGEHSLERLF